MKINTRKEAIDNMCKQCIYDSKDVGTWKDQVERCTAPDCPLYTFRPVSQATTNSRKEEKFNAMTPDQQAAYRKRQDETRERFAQAPKEIKVDDPWG